MTGYFLHIMEYDCSCFHQKIPPKKIVLYSCIEEYERCPKYDEDGNKIHGMNLKCNLCIKMYAETYFKNGKSHLHCSICKKKIYIKFYPENSVYHQGKPCDEYMKT